MKKLFKFLSLLRLFQALRGGRRHRHSYGGYGHHRSSAYYPLHHRPSFRRTIADRVLSRVLGGRRY